MKKFLILGFIVACFSSCSLSDDDDNNISYDLEVLPIESVDIPDEFMLGEVYPITVNYLRPSTCNAFHDFYFQRENNERTVAVITSKYNRDDCENLTDELAEATFNFQVTSNGSYIFKFWQGTDEEEKDKFLIIEVPVVE